MFSNAVSGEEDRPLQWPISGALVPEAEPKWDKPYSCGWGSGAHRVYGNHQVSGRSHSLHV